MKKKTSEELLREQLELLAEQSKQCDINLLPIFTEVMIQIHYALNSNSSNQFSLKSD